MGLHLSSSDTARFQQTTEALLSPLEHSSVSDWCAVVLRRTEELFGADRSLLILPGKEMVWVHSDSLPSAMLPVFQTAAQAVLAKPTPSRWPDFDAVVRARRAMQLEVWSVDMLQRLTDTATKGTPWDREVMGPAGVNYGSGITIALPHGEAWLALAWSRPADDRFGVQGGMDLLRMLLPAFKAGAGTLVRLQQGREALAWQLDAGGYAALAYRMDGLELHRTQRFTRMLADEPEAKRLEAEARALAVSVAALRRLSSKTAEPHAGTGTRDVATPGKRYRLRAAYAPAGTFCDSSAVIIEIEDLSPSLPSAHVLVERHGLTAREAEIALLLAAGVSNRRVASRLGISPHTVRAHVEHIFTKLGIHARSALGATLLSDPSRCTSPGTVAG